MGDAGVSSPNVEIAERMSNGDLHENTSGGNQPDSGVSGKCSDPTALFYRFLRLCFCARMDVNHWRCVCLLVLWFYISRSFVACQFFVVV